MNQFLLSLKTNLVQLTIFLERAAIKHQVSLYIPYSSSTLTYLPAYQPESVASSSSSSPSKNSSRHGTPPRSNSFNSPNIHPSPDRNNRDEQFIEQVDEEFSPGEQAVVDENDRILCIDGTRVIQEDYTVVLQVITHGLETDSSDFDQMTHDAFEQFKSEIDQLNQ